MRGMTRGMTLGFSQRFLPPVAPSRAGSARRSRPISRFPIGPTFVPAAETMDSSGAAAASRAPGSNPKLSHVQSLLEQDGPGGNPNLPNLLSCSDISTLALPDGWQRCWEEGITPWDLGSPTPVIEHLAQTGDLPRGRALVPGCGGGHDVVAMACAERFVVGVDISETAMKKAAERTSGLPNKECFTFLAADFFSWQPTEQFDLIFDYTFFCAIDPSLRSAWADRIGNLLKPDGELITLIYPVDTFLGGPPFAVSVDDYEEVLGPLGFNAVSVEDNELAIKPRKGREKLGRWKRKSWQALM